MTTDCTGCHQPVDPAARFCPACGSPQTPQSRPSTDERRLATVVIGDLVGFTSLSEKLDPELVKSLIDRVFQRLGKDITSHGGIVDKVVGDAIVALFGAPVAHEDDPERAVRAALAMHHSVAAVGAELGVDLQMRIGVNTGEVLVGGLSTGDAYTAMGDAVNVASRLETAAPAGAVLVGDATHEATRDSISYVSHGLVQVRGRTEPVPTWIALQGIGAPGTGRRRWVANTFGRDAEAGLLDAVLDVVVATERAHLVEISGDAGMGKRRIAEAFVERARTQHDALVMQARIAPYGEASMWAPAAQLLSSAVGTDVDLTDTAVRQGVVATVLDEPHDSPKVVEYTRALSHLFEGDEPEPGSPEDVEVARLGAVNIVIALVDRLARGRPVISLLTNAQWGDAALLDLLTRVLVGVRRRPVLALMTTRDAASIMSQDHQQDLELLGAVNLTWLRLSPLADTAAAALARQLLGPDADEDAVAAAVRRSGGNPLILEEIAGLAADDRSARVGDMPLTLRGLVSARLDLLDAQSRQLVDDAAMIGYTAPLTLLSDVTAARGEPLDDSVLERMQDLDLFVVADGTYRFRTDALREAAYLRLPKSERVSRHAAIGRRLGRGEARTGGTSVRRSAQHLATAAELAASINIKDPALVDDAVTALLAAAEWAGGRDPAVSLAFAERAIALQDGSITEALTSGSLQLVRATALADLNRYDEAAEVAEGLLTGTDRIDVLRARALTVRGQVEQTRGLLPESTATLREAVSWAKTHDEHDALALSLRTLGMTLIFRGDNDGAIAVLEEALGIYAAHEDRAGMAWAQQHLGWALFNQGDLTRSLTLANEAHAWFDMVGDTLGTAFVAGMRGWISYVSGDLGDARAAAELAIKSVPASHSQGLGRGLAQVLVASIALWEGDTTEAVTQASGAVSLFSQIGHRWGEALGRLTLGRALAHLGQGNAALAQARIAEAIATALGDTANHNFFGRAQASIHIHLGDPAAAERLLATEGAVPLLPDHERMLALVRMQQADPSAVDLIIKAQNGPSSPSAAIANAAAAGLVFALMGDKPQLALVTGHAQMVQSAEQATYQDRFHAALAMAILAHRQGRVADRTQALDAATAALANAEDMPLAALLDVVRRRMSTDPHSDDSARTILGNAGVRGDGWFTVASLIGVDRLADHVPG